MASKISGISIAKIDENEVVIPKNSNKRVAWWRVNLGKKITGSKKVRRFFSKESEAKEFIAKTLETRVQEGHEAFILTPALRLEARKCQEVLDKAAEKAGRRLTLTEAIGYFLRHALPQGGTRTFSDAKTAFLANRKAKNLKPRYIVNLESQFRQLESEFAVKRVNTITSPDLEEWLNQQKWAPKTKNNYVVTLRTFFDFCQKQKWCADNPGEQLEKIASDETVTGILTVTEAARILEAAQRFPDVLPAIAIQLFAGLRRSEVCALDWSEIKDDVLFVTAGKSKTRTRRVVSIQPVLASWLQPYRRIKGRVFEKSVDGYNEQIRDVIEEANQIGAKQTPPWPPIQRSHNCLRHTCASMHLAHFGDENLTAFQMGHSAEILHTNYKGLVTRDEAAAFWAIKPLPKKRAARPIPIAS
jgi:integrase